MIQFTILRCIGSGLLCNSFLFVFSTFSAHAVTLEWDHQFGTSINDEIRGVSADGLGSVYFVRESYQSSGDNSAFLAKYDAEGSHLWTREIAYGSRSVYSDGQESVYISGSRNNDVNPFNKNAFVEKYDADGSLLWTRELGTESIDLSNGVSADLLGNVYISGETHGGLDGPNAGPPYGDAFLAKYDDTGSLLWTRQLGTSSQDYSDGVAADGLGNIFVTGATQGSLGGPNAGTYDAFIAKYDVTGSLLWTRQLGTARLDSSKAISTDGLGNAYIVGETGGSLGGPNAGPLDAFVAKYDTDGALLWTRQLGTGAGDQGWAISSDGLGNIYIAGSTGGSLGVPNAGSSDAFVAKYNSDGVLLWTQQFGTSAEDRINGVSADGQGNFYVGGYTNGSLDGPNAGEKDAFIAKFVDSAIGDFNLDGTVDAADYTVWRDGKDTIYTQSSYDLWRANFGRTEAEAAGEVIFSRRVPEPCSVLLLTLAFAGAYAFATRRAAGQKIHI